MRILTHYIYYILTLTGCLLILTGCRQDEFVSFITDTDVADKTVTKSYWGGMYVLCEGNMGSNKCTLDYLDLAGNWSADDGRIHYLRNIFGQQNPSSVMELGDVGNDIQIYGSQLWIVVNCSNKVEVCHANDARRIGQVNVPNARYVTFHEGFAYISSYVGGISTANEAPRGCVYKVDTLSLQMVDSVLVGYQPEEMAVSNHQLFVANSGGYRAPDFDHTMSVIDLAADKMRVVRNIDVAPNLHHVVADKYGHIWVNSRGDYATAPAQIHCIDVAQDQTSVAGGQNIMTIDLPVASFSLAGDTLFCLNNTDEGAPLLSLINTRTKQQITDIDHWQKQIPKLVHPYGIIANPETRDFYLMDAKNYVSSGELLHFHADGTFDWRVNTGDIPSRAVFVSKTGCNHLLPSQSPTTSESPYIAGVDEYVPAPGQFINTLPLYEIGDDKESMIRKCFEAIGENRQGLVSLGGFGGYITFHFHQPVTNVPGEFDLQIFGNANVNGSEPGIVMVSADENGNGLPDDTWYELAGSASANGKDSSPIYNYRIEYQDTGLADIPWSDNQGQQGFIYRNEFHAQPYYPQWLSSPLSFTGTRLPDNSQELSGQGSQWELHPFDYGYVDNLPNADESGNSFDLSWAVDIKTRQPIALNEIHFVRVYSAMNQTCGWLGETSTEISGARICHTEK